MKNWKNTAEIIILGGGILGTSVAHNLAKKGQKQVVLLEKEFLCEGSTGLSVGGFRQQFSTPANILLSRESVQLFKHFEDEFGVEIDMNQPGYLFLAREAQTWKDLKNGVRIQEKYSVPIERLSPEEINHRWSYIKTRDLLGGTFCPEDGYADPYLVTMAYAKEAKKQGVLILENTEVTGILVKHGRVSGVDTSIGKILAPRVFNVAGPWGGKVARMVGLDLPVLPYRRQVFVITCSKDIPQPVPMVIDMDMRHYFRGESSMILTGMSDLEEPSSFNLQVDQTFMIKVVEALVQRAPVMADSKMIRGWAGLYAVTPDENPIIGEVDIVDGFYCAIGFSGHGFQHGPAVGRILSELILEGKTDFDLSPFAYDRFGKTNLPGEKRAV